MKLLINISFLGTKYCGWQKQKNRLTVQEIITDASKQLFGFACDVTGCSRTDSGVHANSFCACVSQKGEKSLATSVPLDKIPRAFNNFLPEDIAVIGAMWVEDEFHPRYDVVYKEYVYLICDRPERDPFLSGRCWHIPKRFSDSAVKNMDIAAKKIVGKYDFSAFMAAGSKIEDAVRTVKYAECTREGNLIKLRIAADGFLYNMVRIIAGTLAEVGEGKRSPESIPGIIESKQRKCAGRTAPPDGLYLNKVSYDKC